MAAVEDKDLGYTAIITQLKALGDAEISVGVLRNAGKEKDGTDLVDVAVYNEYGTRNIPPRPFLRIATDEHGGEWQDLAEKCVGKIIEGALDENRALHLIGLQAQKDVQATIKDSSNFTPNAPATIARKGSSKPLIDTGRLRQSIRYRVEE